MTIRGGVDGRVRRILVQCVDVSANQVVGSAGLVADLEMDSLDFAEVALELEREFAVAVAGDRLARVETVDALVDLVYELTMTPSARTAQAPRTPGAALHA